MNNQFSTIDDLKDDMAMKIDNRKTVYTAVFMIGLISILLLPLLNTYLAKVVYTLYMYVALGYGWNYISGYTGYINFGPVMFFGFGAYGAGFFVTSAGQPWFAALIESALLSTILCVLIGLVFLRISGIYFSIGTLILAEGFLYLVLWEGHLTDFLGGSSGLQVNIIPLNVGYILFLALTLASIIITYETATSQFGKRMMAVREDETALELLGVSPRKYKILPFMFHGAITAIAGGTFALLIGYINPYGVFGIEYTLTMILLVILGGMGTVWGPFIGGVILILIQEIFWQQFPFLHLVVYGIFLVAIILWMPEGIISKLKEWGVIPDKRGI